MVLLILDEFLLFLSKIELIQKKAVKMTAFFSNPL